VIIYIYIYISEYTLDYSVVTHDQTVGHDYSEFSDYSEYTNSHVFTW